MDFVTAAKLEASKTETENGQVALNTTGNSVLDFYSLAGALRDSNKERITDLFERSYTQDPLATMKIVFYLRDIRGGLGERKTFKTLCNYMGNNYPEVMKKNLHLVPFFGRYDDFYCFVGTKVEDDVWKFIKERLEQDLLNYSIGEPVSLLAKWLKTADASSKKTRKLGIYTAHKLGYSVYEYKRIVRKLREYLKVTEVLMSTNKWDSIDYKSVPSYAMKTYSQRAFPNHDGRRFEEYLTNLKQGKTKINSSTLFPYDIVHMVFGSLDAEYLSVLDEQWKALPNYVEEGNVVVMADTSGSMSGRPLETAISLAIYFAQRNTGAYHNLWMTFSGRPTFQVIKDNTIGAIVRNLDRSGWEMNTNLNAAMELILKVAVDNKLSPEELPKSLVVISDMEIDSCSGELFHNHLVKLYEENGYYLPNIVFWNVNSRHNVFHADSKRKGVQLASGSSPSVFKSVMESIGLDSYEAMMNTLNNSRYDVVTV